MPPAHRILRPLNIVIKRIVAPRPDRVHRKVVHQLDRLMDRHPLDAARRPRQLRHGRLVGGGRVHHVVEAPPPVAEVGADDEGVLRVEEVRCEDLAHLLLGAEVVVPDQDRDDGRELGRVVKGLLEALVEVGEVHLEGVLRDVAAERYVGEGPRGLDGRQGLGVDGQVAEGRLVLGAGGHRAAAEVVRVRGAEDEDAARGA